MTRDEFTNAVSADQRVRLTDRSRCFYTDEWYEPFFRDDGGPAIYTHTGETFEVDDALLAELTTDPAVTTVSELEALLDRYPDEMPVVVDSHPTGYQDVDPTNVARIQIRRRPGDNEQKVVYDEATSYGYNANDGQELVVEALWIGPPAQ